MSEIIKSIQEFEHLVPHETEQKFIPLYPQRLEPFRTETMPIEQYYLSHPSEDFSLRCRETFEDGGVRYEATLKTRGELTNEGLKRLEVTTPISPDMYQFYRDNLPLLRKLRAEPVPHVAIDFFDDGHVQIESEQPDAWEEFCRAYDLAGQFADLTGDHFVDNEWRAHLAYRRSHNGQEVLCPADELDADVIIRDILKGYELDVQQVIQIRGRSGSGKSTVVHDVQRQLFWEYGIISDVISTDDYHRGQTWLETRNSGQPWVDWDDPIVYDTAAMARDLEVLKAGQPVPRRTIDFTVVEPAYHGERQPTPVLLVEGIYAGSVDIAPYCDRTYAMPTPRRLLRDLRERPQFANPSTSLRYMLEYAEPAYRQQAA